MSNNLLCMFFGHKFNEWEYVADNSCEQSRVCKRDGFEEHRQFRHKFGLWEYVADNSCEQLRVCERDGFEERGQFRHNFGKWEYSNADSRKQVCQKCSLENQQIKKTCPKCYGKGRVSFSREEEYEVLRGHCGGAGDMESYTQGLAKCIYCDGTGVGEKGVRWVSDHKTCPDCNGEGYIWSPKI